MMTEETRKILCDLDVRAAHRRKAILDAASVYPTDGTVYYVSETGDDGNDGLSPAHPLRSTAFLSETDRLKPGDTVLFARGETFRGQLICHEGVTYSAYGEGPKPLLTASPENAAYAACWERVPGTENIYRYTKPICDVGAVVFDGGTAHSIKEIPSYIDDTYYIRGTKTPFDFKKNIRYDLGIFCDCATAFSGTPNGKRVPAMYSDKNIGTLYLRCDRGNPGTIFGSIELSRRINEIIPKNGVTIDNLCIKYAGSHGVGGGNNSKLTVRNCEIGWIGGGIQFYNNEGVVTRYGNGVEIYVSCSDYTVENCWLYEIYDAAITHQFSGSQPAPCSMKHVRYRGNLIENCVYSIEYFLNASENPEQKMSDILIEDNIMRNAGVGFGTQRPDGATPAHIKGWDHANPAESFRIQNNIFDRSGHMLVHIGFADPASKPQFSGNTYIQHAGGELGRVGPNPTSLIYCTTEKETENVINERVGDKEAHVYLI